MMSDSPLDAISTHKANASCRAPKVHFHYQETREKRREHGLVVALAAQLHICLPGGIFL
jgi:hypothetical protein